MHAEPAVPARSLPISAACKSSFAGCSPLRLVISCLPRSSSRLLLYPEWSCARLKHEARAAAGASTIAAGAIVAAGASSADETRRRLVAVTSAVHSRDAREAGLISTLRMSFCCLALSYACSRARSSACDTTSSSAVSPRA